MMERQLLMIAGRSIVTDCDQHLRLHWLRWHQLQVTSWSHLNELDSLVKGEEVEDVAGQEVVVLVVCHDVTLQLQTMGKVMSLEVEAAKRLGFATQHHQEEQHQEIAAKSERAATWST